MVEELTFYINRRQPHFSEKRCSKENTSVLLFARSRGAALQQTETGMAKELHSSNTAELQSH